MTLIIFMVVAAAAFLGGLGLFLWQYRQLKINGHEFADKPITLGNLLQKKIDQWYYLFGFFFKQVVHYAYFYFLIILRRVVIIVRYILVRVERRFSKIIDSISGKGTFHKKGAVSVFLTQISESK